MNWNPFDFSDCQSHQEIDDAIFRRIMSLVIGSLIIVLLLAISEARL